MTAASFADTLREMTTEYETLRGRYQDGMTLENASIIQPKIDRLDQRIEALKAGVAALLGN